MKRNITEHILNQHLTLYYGDKPVTEKSLGYSTESA